VQNIKETFEQKMCIFSDSDERNVFVKFLSSLDEMFEGRTPFTLELDDPLGYSFVWRENIEEYSNIRIEE